MNNNELDKLYICEDDADEVPGQLSYFEMQENETSDEDQKAKPVSRENSSKNSRGGRRSNQRFRSLAGILVGVVIGVLICVAIFSVSVVKSHATSADMDYQSKLDWILTYLRLFYLGDLDDQMIEDALAKGLLQNIGDKYAQYYTPEEFQQLIEETNGSYSGIGVMITQEEDGSIVVYKVYKGSPAQEAGVQAMDVIVEADGHRDFANMDELVSLVRGKSGTYVDIVVKRGEEEIPLTVERREIEVESIYSEMISDTVGYIQIAEFTLSAVTQFNDALDSLLDQGMEAVIMDLRDNPGGDYDSVVSICDRVLPEGIIVSVEDRQGGILTENSDAQCLDIPIVLLVNENTASAAELFSMALHDYGMAEIVGTLTYGKGVVQSIFQLMDGSGLKFTTEKYYGPNGDCIQDTGVEPDYVVEIAQEAYEDGYITLEEDVQLLKAAELLGLEPDQIQIGDEE